METTTKFFLFFFTFAVVGFCVTFNVASHFAGNDYQQSICILESRSVTTVDPAGKIDIYELIYDGHSALLCSSLDHRDCSVFIPGPIACFTVKSGEEWHAWLSKEEAKCWNGACDVIDYLITTSNYVSVVFSILVMIGLLVNIYSGICCKSKSNDDFLMIDLEMEAMPSKSGLN